MCKSEKLFPNGSNPPDPTFPCGDMAGRGGARGRGTGYTRPAPPPELDEAVVAAVHQLQKDGDLGRFMETSGGDVNRELKSSKLRTTPFMAMLEGLTHAKQLTSPAGIEAVRQAVQELGARWSPDAFTRMLRGIVELRAVADARELVDLARASGALWAPSPEAMFYGHNDFCFQTMVPLLLAAGLGQDPASLELLERSLAECGVENPMQVMLEGGGTLFSCLVHDLASHGVLGSPAGDALIDLAMRHGAAWTSPDGWCCTPFEDIFSAALRSGPRRRETSISPETALAYLEKLGRLLGDSSYCPLLGLRGSYSSKP